jgi:hypothetical protein
MGGPRATSWSAYATPGLVLESSDVTLVCGQQAAIEGRNGVLWVFRPSDKDFAGDADKASLECRRHMVFAPTHTTERIAAQVAWFTVHKAWSKHPEFEPLERSPELSSKLMKVVIPADRFAHLRFHLDRYGVNNASAFPGLDGLCAHIKWKRCYISDEGDSRASAAA